MVKPANWVKPSLSTPFFLLWMCTWSSLVGKILSMELHIFQDKGYAISVRHKTIPWGVFILLSIENTSNFVAFLSFIFSFNNKLLKKGTVTPDGVLKGNSAQWNLARNEASLLLVLYIYMYTNIILIIVFWLFKKKFIAWSLISMICWLKRKSIFLQECKRYSECMRGSHKLEQWLSELGMWKREVNWLRLQDTYFSLEFYPGSVHQCSYHRFLQTGVSASVNEGIAVVTGYLSLDEESTVCTTYLELNHNSSPVAVSFGGKKWELPVALKLDWISWLSEQNQNR